MVYSRIILLSKGMFDKEIFVTLHIYHRERTAIH